MTEWTGKMPILLEQARRFRLFASICVHSRADPADLTDEQILERLLKLNLERAAEEAKSAQVKKPKTSRAKREDEML
jgi:hypothetical protein